MQALDTSSAAYVPRPELAIALDVLRKELDERLGAARAAGEQVDGNIKDTLQQVSRGLKEH
jgi:hypothetical protein